MDTFPLIIVISVFLFLPGATVAAQMTGAADDNQTVLVQNTGVSIPPMIAFDGLTTPGTSAYNATELRIPSSIKKYELLTFDIPKMWEMLVKNETITIRINGVPYQTNLRDSTGKNIGLPPSIRSYRGTLENMKDSVIAFYYG